MAHLAKLKFSDKQRSQVKMTVEGRSERLWVSLSDCRPTPSMTDTGKTSQQRSFNNVSQALS